MHVDNLFVTYCQVSGQMFPLFVTYCQVRGQMFPSARDSAAKYLPEENAPGYLEQP